MPSPRVRAVLRHPALGVLLVYLFGVAVRVNYTLNFHPPADFISSDMGMYVALARRLMESSGSLMPWDVTHPLGYPALVAFLMSDGGSLARVADLQIVVSCLVPLALGLLGAAAFGRRTALCAVAVASIYFPFIEYGALILTEIHFILWLTLAFAGFLGAVGARRRGVSIALAVGGGVALSFAISMKAVGLIAAVGFFAVQALAVFIPEMPGASPWRVRLAPWALRVAFAAVGAAPLLGVLARACTRANRGQFCVAGNKPGADFLLGHDGRIADIEWAPDEGHLLGFGSPGAYLRHYETHVKVPFTITDNAANSAAAWHWIFAHPFEAIVLSLDHLYDTFFGVAMWPTFNSGWWPYAHLSQYAFVVFLFVPAVFACVGIAKRGARALLTSRTFLVLSPVLALALTVAIATGEVRYRIPFDVFFIVVACALVAGDIARVDGAA